MTTPKPKYSFWEAINISLALGAKTLEEIRALSRQPGPPGKDGQDGLSIEDFKMEYDGERTFAFSFARGATKKTFPFKMPVMIYRGVYKEGQAYEKGDTVTWGGSLWHCDTDGTNDKPDGSTKSWTLASKRGRDGKDGGTK
ncbi:MULTISPECIES: hypothetical protein [unclassified Mesorhizobium]|uniref:hypothetical protein n=1 Tax=unclassified Mesorhizobium TaxID=325217 RepID=UPI000FDA8D63|nr:MULTISPECIES: hypothetical protein [unclassified Mesorhizobium]TGT76719.1 hypothetical protein EN809_003695 [Mesorhizobium sp. M2E.F.Ca.ET.166.01.1.1]TGW02831.1 hypothetical protein EN797_003695 [Mesorhizobium sp. M2E.F.Ca.ET.154.01.1.1]